MNKAVLSILFLLAHIPILSQVDYKTQIEPIFYDKCSGCHTSGGSSGGLDLASYSELMKGGNSGASIIAGESRNSLLWKRINDGSMPPSSNDVMPSNVELVKKWINEGAHEKPKSKTPKILARHFTENVTQISQLTLDVLSSEGLKPINNQYINIADWDNDKQDDIVLQISAEPTINSHTALFKRSDQGGKIRFIEDHSYLMSIQGDLTGYEHSAGDFNGDNLIDILIPTENYHGPDGQEPSFMPGKNETSNKLFINTGKGVERLILDRETYLLNGNSIEYGPTSGAIAVDWDFDGKVEILVSDKGNQRIEKIGNIFDKIFTSFEIDDNNNITREFVFDWPYKPDHTGPDFLETRMQFFKLFGDTLYLAHFKKKAWNTTSSSFVSTDLIDYKKILAHWDPEILVFDIRKSFGKDGLVKRIPLATEFKGGDFIYQNAFHVVDIDNDNKFEFIQQNWYENDTKRAPYFRISDDDGSDITAQWLGDDFMATHAYGGGNGMYLVDFNNDGFLDILPKDGWHYTAESHNPPQVEGDYGTFGIFMNDGSKFVLHHIDFTQFGNLDLGGGALTFNHPIDIDNDNRFEVLIAYYGYNTFKTGLVQFDFKNKIKKIDNISIPEDSMITLTLEAADFWGNAVAYEAKSSNQNVNISLVNDTLKIQPKADWNGSSTITAYASGPTWKDSSVFIATVKSVNDTPKPFFWNTVKLDTINITMDNLASTYDLDWTESVDVDGDSIIYFLYAGTGPSSKVEVYRTTKTTHLIPYNDFLQRTFDQVPVASSATVYFTVFAYDGTDSVKISRDDRELYINRYEYLSVDDQGIPDEFALHDNYPNPFNPSTQIRFDFPKMTSATLTIYNMLGQKVKTFYMQNSPAGYQAITWNATSDLGVPVAAGVYLYQLQTEEFVKTKKMILLK